jgi:hypothetical protein
MTVAWRGRVSAAPALGTVPVPIELELGKVRIVEQAPSSQHESLPGPLRSTCDFLKMGIMMSCYGHKDADEN